MAEERKKILILYASYGDGHIQVSKALKEQFESDGCEVVLTDLFAEAYPLLNELTKFIYIKSYTLFPKLYGWSYYSTREMRDDTLFSSWFHSWGLRKLKEVLRREQPDAVVNTFPMLAMPELRKRTGVAIPIFTVMTDYVLHSRWIHRFIDKYYVATEDLRTQMIALGILAERIIVSGIPLKRSFQSLTRSEALYEKYGLDRGRRTLLIMAGSYGVLSGLRNICSRLASLPETQLLIVCGKNESLLESLRAAAGHLPNVHLLGFCKEMHELMSISEAIVTKPGGVTLTESIQCGLPLILLRPVPGQERDNAVYLASKGAAFIANDDEALVHHVKTLLGDSPERRKALQAISALRKANATQLIVHDILDSLGTEPAQPEAPVLQRGVMSGHFS